MKLKSVLFGVIAAALLASCSTSNDVVSGRGIQKRKYNDGYYISLGKKFNKTDKVSKSEDTELASDEIEYTPVEETITFENSTVQPPLAESNYDGEILTPEIDQNTPDQVTYPETNSEEGNVAKSEEINESEEGVFQPGRIYSPKIIRTKLSESSVAHSGGVMLILLVILCFFIPPLAVFIFEGATTRFWIDLILFIIGIAVVGWLLSGISGLALLVSIIYALLIVLSVI